MAPSRATTTKDRQRWTAEQDAALVSAVAKVSTENSEIDWHQVANYLPSRTNKNCRKRWHYQISREIRKGPWTAEEDQKLRDAVQKHGAKWSIVSDDVVTRNGDQCWKRWNDNLDPSIDHSPWSAKEDTLLLEVVQSFGRNWSDIVSRHFPRRTALAAKNRFSLLSRRMENPQTRSKSRVYEEVSAPASPPTSSPSSSQSRDEDDAEISLQDNEIGTMPIDTVSMDLDPSDSIANHLNGFEYDADLMAQVMSPTIRQAMENPSYLAPNSMISLSEYVFPQLSDLTGNIFENEIDFSVAQENQSADRAPSDQHLLFDDSTKELVIRVTCRAERTESTMEGLTKLINSLMIQGDVKDVKFSIT